MADEKILDEEIMSDEDLESVSGGSTAEITIDVHNFKDRGYDVTSDPKVLKILFKKFGIDAELHLSRATYKRISVNFSIRKLITPPNVYKINGKEVTQKEAWAHIDKQLKNL